MYDTYCRRGVKIPRRNLILTASWILRIRQRGCRCEMKFVSVCCRWSFDNSIKIRRAEKQSFRHAKLFLPRFLFPFSFPPFLPSLSISPSLVSPSNLDCKGQRLVGRAKVTKVARWRIEVVNRETSRNERSESESPWGGRDSRDVRQLPVHDSPLIHFTTVVPPD